MVLPEKYNLVSIDAVHSPANGHYVKSIKESILSESLSMNDSALAVDILRRLDKQLHTDLASQQNRMSTSDTYDNLFAGHDGFPSLKNLRMAALQHLQRMDDDTFRVLANLFGLQDDGQYAVDDEGLAGSKYKYAKVGIKDPIARARQYQADWQTTTDKIHRERALQHLNRVGKFNT